MMCFHNIYDTMSRRILRAYVAIAAKKPLWPIFVCCFRQICPVFTQRFTGPEAGFRLAENRRRPSSRNTGSRGLVRRVKKRRASGQHKQQNDTDHDAAEPEEADLAVAQGENLLKHAAPSAGREKRQETFDHQHQGQCLPKGVAVHLVYFLAGAAPLPEPGPRIALKKSEDGSNTITSLFLLKLAL